MPQYLLHGFRWSRAQIRIFVIFHDLEDATADYIQLPDTVAVFRDTIFRRWPHLEAKLPGLTFIEQHDPDDLCTGAQPWAFIADTVHAAPPVAEKKVKEPNGEHSSGYSLPQGLCLSVEKVVGGDGASNAEAKEAMVFLKNELAKEVRDVPMDADVGWWAAWNGDVERRVEDPGEGKEEQGEGEEGTACYERTPNGISQSIHT